MEEGKFEVIVLGIIFDPIKKKILIGKRENDPKIKELTWCFPGGRLHKGEDIDRALKRSIKEKTGYIIKNLGAFFSKTYPENPELVSICFLTKVFEGIEKPGGDLVELRWVDPKDLGKYFTTSYHKKLKEFIEELV
jgi:ADP-ribose pyrophosphatase YjhB (NUDIX family)